MTNNDNLLPAYCKARVLILGVGNILFGNDGFGPAVIKHLQEHYTIPEDIYVMDTGTGVRKLLFTLTISDTRPDEIVVVDAVDWGKSFGEISEIKAEDLPASKIDDFSLHQIPTSNMLRELQEICGVDVSVVVCDIGDNVPEMISEGLSPEIESAAAAASHQIAARFKISTE